MPSVGVIFEIRRAETLPGQTIRIVGGCPELGAWDPRGDACGPASAEADVLRLKTGALSYPRWSTSAPVWIHFEDESKEFVSPGELSQFSQRHIETISTMDGFDEVATMDSIDSVTSSEPSTPRVSATKHDDGFALITPGCTKLLDIEYKFLKDLRQLDSDDEGCFKWEDKISNRRVLVPQEPGSMWLVSDALWNSDEPPSVSRIADADVLARCLELDPDYMLNRNKPALELSYPMTPRCSHPTSGGPPFSFAIEDEFEALANRELPELLATKLAAERTASDLASELLDLQHENGVMGAAKEQAEEEVKSLRDEVAEIKDALLAMTRSAEASSGEHAAEVQMLRTENLELREENAQLLYEVQELRVELSNARAALVTREDRTQELEDELRRAREEIERLRKESAEHQRESSAELVLATPSFQREMSEASEAMQTTSIPFERRSTAPAPGLIQHDVVERPRLSFGSRRLGVRRDIEQQGLSAERRLSFFGSKASSPTSGAAATTPQHDARDLKDLLAEVRASLSATPLTEKCKREAESELMKVLRRRREQIRC